MAHSLERKDDKLKQEAHLARKQRSERILRAANVPINPNLPYLDVSDGAKPRTGFEISARAIALLLVAATCEFDRGSLVDLIDDHGGNEHFTRSEAAFLNKNPWPLDDILQFGWRVETCWALLWALGYVADLGLPTDQTSPGSCIDLIEGQTPETLAGGANLRHMSEILDEADLMYRCHWATRQAELTGEALDELEPGVTFERRWALEWMIQPEIDWDETAPNT